MKTVTVASGSSPFLQVWNNDTISSLLIMAMRSAMLLAKFILSVFMASSMGLEQLGIYGLIVGASAATQAVMRGGIFRLLSRDAVNQPIPELTYHLHHYGLGVLALYFCLAPVAWGVGLYFDAPLLGVLILLVFFTEHLSFDSFTLINDLQYPKLANFIYSLQSASWIYVFVLFAFFYPSLRSLTMLCLFWVGGGILSLALSAWLSRAWPWRDAFSRRLEWHWYMKKIKSSFKLYITDIVGIINYYMDRYIVTLFLNLEMTGIYVFFSQIVMATVNLVSSGVLAIYRPRLINAYKNSMEDFNRTFKTCLKKTYFSAVLLSLFVALAVPFLLPYTDNAALSTHIYLLWMMLGAMFCLILGTTAETALYAMHKDGDNLAIVIIKFVLMACVGSAGIYFFGIYGIVLNMIVISFVPVIFARIVWNKAR